jgi:hypothetical protein
MNPPWKAGAAASTITPTEPMWLAGWAARREPANGAAMDLFAKALALEDSDGQRAVIVTADLIAIPRDLASRVAETVRSRWQLPRECLLFNASHTHTGPEIRPDKVPFFEIPDEFARKIIPYVGTLQASLEHVISEALERLEPATFTVHQTEAPFIQNRRSPTGPVDPSVPILQAAAADGGPLALLFGCACHNLVMPPSFCQYHGDFAGCAQQLLEAELPGTVALYLSGAGADLDPAPRGTLELAKQHGATLATRIRQNLPPRTSRKEVLISVPSAPPTSPSNLDPPYGGRYEAKGLSGPLRTAFEEVSLPFLPMPPVETLEAELCSADPPRARKARFLLDAFAARRLLPSSYPCPIQVLRFGNELLLVALGGEASVDYALQFKKDFSGPLVWVAGYSNDMFGYLPTRRILLEGGYEGGRAILWSALPAPFDESVEGRVLEAVRRLVMVVTQ